MMAFSSVAVREFRPDPSGSVQPKSVGSSSSAAGRRENAEPVTTHLDPSRLRRKPLEFRRADAGNTQRLGQPLVGWIDAGPDIANNSRSFCFVHDLSSHKTLVKPPAGMCGGRTRSFGKKYLSPFPTWPRPARWSVQECRGPIDIGPRSAPTNPNFGS